MPILIPFEPSNPNYRLTTIIEGKPYHFDVSWAARDVPTDPEDNKGTAGSWSFNLYEEDETLIVADVKIVLGAYMGRESQHVLFRNGILVALDTERNAREPGLDDLGTRVHVRYYTIDEIIGGDLRNISDE